MFSTTLNLFPVIFTVITGVGVMMHDTQLDHAAVTAMSSASSSAAHAAAPSGSPDVRGAEHIHTDNVRLSQTLKQNEAPKLQTRHTDVKKYLGSKIPSMKSSPV